HHRADKILLGEQQLGLAISVNVGGAQPGLLDAAAGGRDVHFVEVLARDLAKHFHFFVGDQDDKVGQAILVGVAKSDGGGIRFEALAELLGPGLAVGGAGDQGAAVVLVGDDREGGPSGGLEFADG